MKIKDKIKGIGPNVGLAIAAGVIGVLKLVVDSKVKANDKAAFKAEIVEEAVKKMSENSNQG